MGPSTLKFTLRNAYFQTFPQERGYNYLNMYVRKDNYLTYVGESYKRIDDENKSITWKDGSKSLMVNE